MEIDNGSNVKANNAEYTNTISAGQEASRFVGLISPREVIGYPYDYSRQAMSEINAMTNEAFNMLYDRQAGGDIRRAYFSFLSFNIMSLDFGNVENIMRQHKFTSVVYDLSKRFTDLMTIKYDRVYYTRLYHKTTGKFALDGLTRTEMNKAAFPTCTTGDDPSARIARGEFGNLLACQKIRLADSMNKTYGSGFDKESDWIYVLHVDFRVYFNFNNLKVLQHAMKDRQWAGALLTFVNWAARHKESLKKNWEYSERWYIDYADYQCARNIPWYDLDERSGRCIHIRMPYTFEYWEQYCRPHTVKEDYTDGQANHDDTAGQGGGSYIESENESNFVQDAHFKHIFYINKTTGKTSTRDNANAGNGIGRAAVRADSRHALHAEDLHPPD